MRGALAFAGALAIHLIQVALAHEAFSLSARELNLARDVIAAENDAAARGLSAFSLNGKMVDPPVVRRARDILALSGRSDLPPINGDRASFPIWAGKYYLLAI
ncbi:hypothetical protein [Mesorhizobium sp.]|uniref:hypothetical protein n=1 Tax=Mesorhizobium sp. TaxID=1871066 RepID=UPI0025CF129F|nr:hypothetical protein [Mesorhizobium sp.]